MKSRGKTIALTTVAVGIVVLVAAGIAAKDRIVEEWYLCGLLNAAPTRQSVAVDALGRFGSARAVPDLLRLSADANRDKIPLSTYLLSKEAEVSMRALERIVTRYGKNRKNTRTAIPSCLAG